MLLPSAVQATFACITGFRNPTVMQAFGNAFAAVESRDILLATKIRQNNTDLTLS